MRWIPLTGLLLLGVAVASLPAAAQCSFDWRVGGPVGGIDGSVIAMTKWDPDGAGPEPELLVVAGYFRVAGDALSMNIATWDGLKWHSLGNQKFNGAICAVCVYNNEIVVGGSFTAVGETLANRIARWDGKTWTAMGEGFGQYYVLTLATYRGRLFAGGFFQNSGAAVVRSIAQWNVDTLTWDTVAGGLSPDYPDPIGGAVVNALAVFQGELVAGGEFSFAGGVVSNCLAAWNGSEWRQFGGGAYGGPYDGTVNALLADDQRLYVSGSFASLGTASIHRVGRWNGTAWESLGAGIDGGNPICRALALHNGDLIVGGDFVNYINPPYFAYIMRWNGSSWQNMAEGVRGRVAAITTYQGQLIVGGDFDLAGTAGGLGISRWTGSAWEPVSPGFDAIINALAVVNGQLYAGGDFNNAGDVVATNVAWLDGDTWKPLAQGFNDVVRCLIDFNGELVAGGDFTRAGSQVVNHIARWDGAQWQPLGTGISSRVNALVVFDGKLIAGGQFQQAGSQIVHSIAQWDGQQWLGFGSGMAGGTNGPGVFALTVYQGYLIAGGAFTSAGSSTSAKRIAQWNGLDWSGLGTGMSAASGVPYVYATAVCNGDLYAGGVFTNAGGLAAKNIARWDGSAWHPLGAGIEVNFQGVFALAEYNGDLIAAGNFYSAGRLGVNSVARWDGQSWHPMGLGFQHGLEYQYPRACGASIVRMGRDLVIGGDFSTAGESVSAYVARWGPLDSCPADIAPSCGDGAVNVSDLLSVILHWGACQNCVADVDNDGTVGVQDLLSILTRWGPCP